MRGPMNPKIIMQKLICYEKCIRTLLLIFNLIQILLRYYTMKKTKAHSIVHDSEVIIETSTIALNSEITKSSAFLLRWLVINNSFKTIDTL